MHGAAYSPEQWSSFFAAQTGAFAALTGLLFVSLSINLQQIVKLRQLTARAAKALTTLGAMLVASSFCLVPAQSEKALGWELCSLGALLWVAATLLQRTATHNNTNVTRAQRLLQYALTQFSTLPLIVGGGSLLWRRGGGLYWLVAAIAGAIFSALIDAWVLLVEILR